MATGTIQIEFDESGSKRVSIEGQITPDHLWIAAAILSTTGDDMHRALVAQARPVGTAAAPIVPIHGNLDDALRGRNGG